MIGNISPDRRGGETIRDTYGDIVLDETGQVRYFEPAVLAAPNVDEAKVKLRLWARFSDSDGGLLENTIAYPAGEVPQRTLVLIKPDNFRFPTGRPGNVIDFFSRTGLYIVGIKVHRMSVAEASEFYGPVREVLRTRLKDVVAARAKAALEKELGFKIPPAEQQQRQQGQDQGELDERLGTLPVRALTCVFRWHSHKTIDACVRAVLRQSWCQRLSPLVTGSRPG